MKSDIMLHRHEQSTCCQFTLTGFRLMVFTMLLTWGQQTGWYL